MAPRVVGRRVGGARLAPRLALPRPSFFPHPRPPPARARRRLESLREGSAGRRGGSIEARPLAGITRPVDPGDARAAPESEVDHLPSAAMSAQILDGKAV